MTVGRSRFNLGRVALFEWRQQLLFWLVAVVFLIDVFPVDLQEPGVLDDGATGGEDGVS